MNTKLFLSILFFAMAILNVAMAQNQTNSTTTAKSVSDNTSTVVNENPTNTVTDKKDNPTATDDPKATGTMLSEETTMSNNTVIDGCGTISAQVGMFSFSKPISKSVLVQYSNFTIIWYYNNIIYDNYTYPTNNVTLSLFYEEDANSNNWASSWKKPVWTKTLSISEIENGPTLTNNVKSYQWDWKINYDDDRENKGFIQALRTNEKYKLRISGDGKDLQTNSDNFKCYHDGDIMPGSTRAFYIVENNALSNKYYAPINVPDGAFSRYITHTTLNIFLILFTLVLYNYF